MAFKPEVLATGIGSVPCTGPSEALNLIFGSLPEIPHWPQMPGRGYLEGFVFQFLTPLVRTGLIRIENDRAYFDSESDRWGERMADFYNVYLAAAEGDPEALEAFSLPEESASGFYAFLDRVKAEGPGEALYFKGQLAGPLTVGFNLKDARGRLAYYQDQPRDLLVKTLAMHGRWQALKLAGLGRPVIIFVDEPAVSVYGKSDYITVTREMIIGDLNEISDQIHSAGALVGVHSCDAIDWSILYQSSLDIVNLDAYNFGDSLIPFAGDLKDYIIRGGILALGMVPTSEKAFDETPESLTGRLENIWAQMTARGVPDQRLKQQTMITPSCGAGLLDPVLAARIYRLTRDLSARVRESFAK